MGPVERFTAAVLFLTVAVMFAIIMYVLPMLPDALPLSSNVHFAYGLKQLIALLSTAGAYGIIAKGLMLTFDHVRLVRRFVLGPAFVEGLWIGAYTSEEGHKQFTVEHFEQTLTDVKVRGTAYNADRTVHTQWTSLAVSVDAESGSLIYVYSCNSASGSLGLATFQFKRKGRLSPPQEMTGYSADLVDGVQTYNSEVKLPNNEFSEEQARDAAIKRFAKVESSPLPAPNLGEVAAARPPPETDVHRAAHSR